MKYCENCHDLVNDKKCPTCGGEVREVSPLDFCFLVEHDNIQARMIMDVLNNNNILHVDVPVRGAGLTMSTSSVEIFRIYVPYKDLEKAHKLIQEG